MTTIFIISIAAVFVVFGAIAFMCTGYLIIAPASIFEGAGE